nr:hypothetical protein [Candidatus Sigynarchaeota archaeon]
MDKNIGSRALEEHNALIKLRIFPGDICEHEFTVFVDDTFKMRS